MKRTVFVLSVILLTSPPSCRGQDAGNIGYGSGQASAKGRAKQAEREKRSLHRDEQPPAGSMFVDAHVLLNVKADEYVAAFGIHQEGATVAECHQKMNATLKEFTEALKKLGISEKEIDVDFVAQSKIYGYEVTGTTAREKLTGFELKKNVSVHYRDRALLDKLTLAAAQLQIYDLIKVDYIVKDTNPIQDRLMEEAARIIKQKTGRYEKLLGIKLQASAQIHAERPSVHYPTQMYDSYRAFEAEELGGAAPYRQNFTVQRVRKSRTFFFNALDGDGFDAVLNPVVIEPVVQFTLYLKVKYEVEQAKAK